MRLRAVRAAIIQALESTTLDTKSGGGDKLVVLKTAREPERVTERTAMVRLLSCGRDDTNTCDAHFAVYQVSEFFSPSDDIDDRIADDQERQHDPLWTLQTIAPDILSSEPGDVFVQEDQGRIVARRDIRVIYRRDQL